MVELASWDLDAVHLNERSAQLVPASVRVEGRVAHVAEMDQDVPFSSHVDRVMDSLGLEVEVHVPPQLRLGGGAVRREAGGLGFHPGGGRLLPLAVIRPAHELLDDIARAGAVPAPDLLRKRLFVPGVRRALRRQREVEDQRDVVGHADIDRRCVDEAPRSIVTLPRQSRRIRMSRPLGRVQQSSLNRGLHCRVWYWDPGHERPGCLRSR